MWPGKKRSRWGDEAGTQKRQLSFESDRRWDFEETSTPSSDTWWFVDTHVELLDGRSATLVGSNHLDLHDLDGVGTCTVAGTHITIWQKRNMVWKPLIVRMGHLCVPKSSHHSECLGCTHSTAWQLQRWSGLCTLCTCCEFHYENHSAARYQNSLPSGVSSRGPEPANSSRALVPPFLIYTDWAEAQVFQVTLHTLKQFAFWNTAGTEHRAPFLRAC